MAKRKNCFNGLSSFQVKYCYIIGCCKGKQKRGVFKEPVSNENKPHTNERLRCFAWMSHNAGPEQFFSRLYTELGKKLYTYLLLRIRDAELSRDISHEVFLKFWILRDSYAQIGDLKAYLFHMARNAIYDVGRQEKRQRNYKDYMDQQATVSQNITQDMCDGWEMDRKLQRAILRLSRQRRSVFVLSKLESWPRKKIAQALGISESTVKATLQNAEKDIQKFTGVVKRT